MGVLALQLLNLKQNDIYKLQQGIAQRHIYCSDLAKILIVTPSLEKQKEILTHISIIRDKVNQLQDEISKNFETVKLKIEQMILT